CQAVESEVTPCDHQGQKANVDMPRKGRAVCRLVEINPAPFRLPLALDRLTEKGESLPEAQVAELTKLLHDFTSAKDALVSLAPAAHEHCWLLRMDSLSSGRLYLVPPGRAARPDAPGYGPVPVGEERPKILRKRLEHIARAQSVLRALALWKEQEA